MLAQTAWRQRRRLLLRSGGDGLRSLWADARRRLSVRASPGVRCCPGPLPGAGSSKATRAAGVAEDAAREEVAESATGAVVAASDGASSGVAAAASGKKRTTRRYRLTHIYSELAKARLSALVVGSAGAGYLLAGAPLTLAGVQGFAALGAGTYLCAAAANTFNQLYERGTDARMSRTRARPLPSGRISTAHAAAFGLTSAATGTALLCIVNSPLVAALGAANIALYAGVYTPMKQMSTLNTTVGAVVGAIPPLMGWAAAAALANPAAAGMSCLALADPWLLAGVLFAWQYPHFLSLSFIHRKDYAAGGHVMHSVVDPSGASAARLALVGGAALTALPLAAVATGAATLPLAVETIVLNAFALQQMVAFSRNTTESKARAVFRTSLWYLPLLMGLMVAHGSHSFADDDDAKSDAAPAAPLLASS